MAKRSKSQRPQEASAPAAEAAARIAPRRKTADRRLRILERPTNGLSVAHIARAEPLTAPRVRRWSASPRRSAARSRRIRPEAKSKGNFPPRKPLKFLETRKESRTRRCWSASPRRNAGRSRRIRPAERTEAFRSPPSRRERLTANGVAGKWRRNGLKRLNPRRGTVWARKPRTYKMWYTGARLTIREPATAASNPDWSRK